MCCHDLGTKLVDKLWGLIFFSLARRKPVYMTDNQKKPCWNILILFSLFFVQKDFKKTTTLAHAGVLKAKSWFFVKHAQGRENGTKKNAFSIDVFCMFHLYSIDLCETMWNIPTKLNAETCRSIKITTAPNYSAPFRRCHLHKVHTCNYFPGTSGFEFTPCIFRSFVKFPRYNHQF